MKKVGLIGNPLKHSFSEQYFGEKFSRLNIRDWSYSLYPMPYIDSLPKLLSAEPKLVGLNITIPYKKLSLKYVHELDEVAAQIGAINTISIDENRRLKGYNTDVIGFENTLVPFLGDNVNDLTALILGSGGAAHAIRYALDKLEIPYTTVSRDANKGITYADLDEKIMRDNHLIINCTPVGTYPNESLSPAIPYKYITSRHFLYDLVYNPKKTLFLQRGARNGAKVINGYSMLEMQAEASWDIWLKDTRENNLWNQK